MRYNEIAFINIAALLTPYVKQCSVTFTKIKKQTHVLTLSKHPQRQAESLVQLHLNTKKNIFTNGPPNLSCRAVAVKMF